MTEAGGQKRVLDGLRVIEIGHFVAAPFATRILGDLGADIIKIEPFAGDPARQWGAQLDGQSLWWSMHGRNKRSVSIDLKTQAEAREVIVLDLIPLCDGRRWRICAQGGLEKLGLGPTPLLRGVRPDLVIAHVSGYGQTGPYRDRAAFGVIGEAIGGLRYLTNHARPHVTDLPPVRVGSQYRRFDRRASTPRSASWRQLWQRDRKPVAMAPPRTTRRRA